MIRLAVAALSLSLILPWLAFATFTTPPALVPSAFALDALYWGGRALDLPIAAFNALLPESLRTHMTVSFQCGHTYCFPRPLAAERMHYVAVGSPAYLVLFAAGACVTAGLRNA